MSSRARNSLLGNLYTARSTAEGPHFRFGFSNSALWKKLAPHLLLAFCLLVVTAVHSVANTPGNRKRNERAPSRVEMKEAERRLSEMGYWTGRVDGAFDGTTRTGLIAFQKWEGRKVTGRLTRSEFEAIRNATSPQARDLGYRHVEIDIDRQVLLLMNNEGTISRILPISTGSGKHYNEKGMSGLAYTPRGRFRIYGKVAGWRKSPLGLLYYPSYFSNGLAIHGNPSVPSRPESHGCIRIPMSATREVSKLLPVGTIVLIYDKESFVSAKQWAEEDKQKQAAVIP
jgi:peptidoglycan hydrolase-like protein with peptidoglycan-binding domain